MKFPLRAAYPKGITECARDLQKGDTAAQELRESGLNAHAVQLEVADPHSVERAAREVEAKFDHLDVLINEARAVSRRFQNGMIWFESSFFP